MVKVRLEIIERREPMKPIEQSKRSRHQEKSSQPLISLGRIMRSIIVICLGLVTIWFFSGQLLIGGVPSSVILTFLQDKPALTAYFQQDKKALHDRLNEIGVEEQIKAYYRPQIPDEVKLDQYIHQVFYDRTGYVGNEYQVNEQGTLTLKQRPKKS
jgi:hypothetical protein